MSKSDQITSQENLLPLPPPPPQNSDILKEIESEIFPGEDFISQTILNLRKQAEKNEIPQEEIDKYEMSFVRLIKETRDKPRDSELKELECKSKIISQTQYFFESRYDESEKGELKEVLNEIKNRLFLRQQEQTLIHLKALESEIFGPEENFISETFINLRRQAQKDGRSQEDIARYESNFEEQIKGARDKSKSISQTINLFSKQYEESDEIRLAKIVGRLRVRLDDGMQRDKDLYNQKLKELFEGQEFPKEYENLLENISSSFLGNFQTRTENPNLINMVWVKSFKSPQKIEELEKETIKIIKDQFSKNIQLVRKKNDEGKLKSTADEIRKILLEDSDIDLKNSQIRKLVEEAFPAMPDKDFKEEINALIKVIRRSQEIGQELNNFYLKILPSLRRTAQEEEIEGYRDSIIADVERRFSDTRPLLQNLEAPENIANAKEAINSFISQASNVNGEMANKLAFSTLQSVPSIYNLDLIKYLLLNSSNVNADGDVLENMCRQDVISSDPDLSEIFDLLVLRGIPAPSSKNLQYLLTHDRALSGQNATKLAKSFLMMRKDASVMERLLDYQIDPKTDSKTRGKILKEKQEMKGFYAHHEITDPESFENRLLYFIRSNDNDDALTQALHTTHAARVIGQIPNHNKVLKAAIDKKLTVTFDLLIKADFDPLHNESEAEAGQTNAFAYACKTQSSTPLKAYLDSIKKREAAKGRDGKKKVRKIINQKDGEGKNALSHAIEGKGYVKAVELLLERGANIEEDYVHNVEVAVEKGHAGILVLLLEKGKKSARDNIGTIINVAKDKGDYVTASIVLDYVRENEILEDSHSLIKDLEEKIETESLAVKPEDLFGICRLKGKLALERYEQNMCKLNPHYTLRDHITGHTSGEEVKTQQEGNIPLLDKEGKTPLFHAMNNAFNSMVSLLVENGADINAIEFEHNQQGELEATNNALSFAITNKESVTLTDLLKSGKASNETIKLAAQTLMLPENNNALLNEAFINNLSPEILADSKIIPFSTRRELLERSIDSGLPDCMAKMKNISKSSEYAPLIEEKFMEAIESQNIKTASHLIDIFGECFAPKTSKSDKVADYAYIETPSYAIRQIGKNASKLNDKFDRTYLKKALDLAMEERLRENESEEDSAGRESPKEHHALNMAQLLLDKGFKLSFGDEKAEKTLQELRLNSNQLGCAVM